MLHSPKPSRKPLSKPRPLSASSALPSGQGTQSPTKSSARGATPIDEEAALDRLRRANLPLRVRRLTGRDLSKPAAPALDYIRSQAYLADVQAGRGFNLAGTDPVRSDVLLLAAKGHALNGAGVWFCSLHYLIHKLGSATEDERTQLHKYQYLFVDFFEKQFGDQGCPYTLHERMIVEEFITRRFRDGFITSFTSSAPILSLTWWSRELLAQIAQQTQDIVI